MTTVVECSYCGETLGAHDATIGRTEKPFEVFCSDRCVWRMEGFRDAERDLRADLDDRAATLEAVAASLRAWP